MSKKRFQKYSGQVFSPLPEATSTNDIFARPTDATAPLKPAAPAQKTMTKADQLDGIVDSHAAFPFGDDLKQLLAAGSFRQSKTLLEGLLTKLHELPAEQWSEFSFAGILNDLLKSRHCAGEALENVLLLFSKLVTKLESGSRGQLELIPVLPAVLEKIAERDASLRKAAEDSISTYLANTLPVILAGPALTEFAGLLASNAKWQVKHRALLAIEQILQSTPDKFVTHRIADLTEDCLHTLTDLKPEVVKASSALLKLLIEKTGNYDIVPQTDAIIKGLADVKNIPMALKTLSGVTFVAEVNRNVLSFLVPILHKALGGFSSQASLRQTVIILENLTRLLPDTRSIKPYVPILKPELQKVIETAAMPEIRSLAENTMSVIEKAEADFSKSSESEENEACRAILNEFKVDSICSRVLSETLDVVIEAKDLADFEVVLGHMAIEESGRSKLINHLKEFAFASNEEEYEGDTPIVDVRFSLAYGGRMLLNQTRLLLYRGHRYGVLGHNGAGKSTLLRAIANGKVEGFPDKDTVKTYFLELKAASRSQDASILEYLHAAAPGMTIEDSQNALLDVGFTEDSWSNPVNNLSGGWRMKLEIAKAILERADILLLDEPTNHLDVSNVKWLENYLLSHTSLTTLIVSHDTGFLDNVCTDVIHYEQKTLQYYKGNVSEFVKVHPEAKSYYAFERSSTTKMAFPPPGILTGVRSVTRAVARLHNVSFTYPGAPKPNLTNVSCSIALNSRVAVIGPNGAGKSTLIKLLTGELIPSEGSIEKHPNLRIGYIAQHALEHVEKHKELTPNQYIQWRYRNGDDSEVHLKQSRQISDEEKAVVEKPIDVGDGGPERYFDAIVGRQKLKKSFRYELSWRGYLPRHNTFMSREELVERGFGKLVQAFDDHEASREGLSFRELHPAVIRKHFEEVGLDGDIADHTPMGSLSGGQLVKVVISGATWNNPHILVLDEPTNYLDRDSLAGLAIAIQNWSGGVIMISHNSEFVDALAKETWLVDNGQLKFSGKTGETPAESTQTSCTESVSEIEGSIANIKLRKKKKKLTRNEQKDREVRRRLRHLEWLSSPKGTPKPEDTDSD